VETRAQWRCGANPGLLAKDRPSPRAKHARRPLEAAAKRRLRPNGGTTSRRCARQMDQLFPTRDRSRCLGSSTPPFYLPTNSIDSPIHRIVLIYTLDRDRQPWRKPCSSLRHFTAWEQPRRQPSDLQDEATWKLLPTKVSAKVR
jgi:hypothetical protein